MERNKVLESNGNSSMFLSSLGVASILYFLAWFFYVPAETKVDENKNQEMALLETKKDRNEEVEEGKA